MDCIRKSSKRQIRDPKVEKPIVAAFDFDGTLTYHDTLFYFLLYTHGVVKAFYYFFFLLPVFIAYLIGKIDRQRTKEKVLRCFFSGRPINIVRKKGEAFAKEKLQHHLRPEAMQRFQWHLKQGHRCILISASLDVYLQPWSKMVGFQESLTSRLADENGIVTGKLIANNCRGPEKVRRLQELIGPREGYYLYAYGDSDGDQELLALAEASFYRKFEESSG
ncbi:MAG TPA: HAD family hydrolase [Waddliaceae bacterium]